MITKICGLTTLDNAEMVASYFPDYLGFVFHEPSPRTLSVQKLSEISDSLRVCFGDGCPQLVAVVVNPTEKFLETIAPFVDVFQLHGEENSEFSDYIQQKFPHHKIWKALRITEISDIEKIFDYKKCDGIVLDSFSDIGQGGTGKKISDSLLLKISQKIAEAKSYTPHQLFLIAGGITTENCVDIQQKTGSDGVDISSGLESKPGHKSEKKVAQFFCGTSF